MSEQIKYKLGKTKARPGAVSMKLSTYLTKSQLPTPPANFGHYELVSNFGMLGNDKYGDCVWAGAGHETEMWCMESGCTVQFNDKCVLSDYAKVTGFKPNDPSTDKGTDMQLAASYRRKTGILDASGKRHKVVAYLAIAKGNLDQHLAASYLFGAVGIGINFPSSAMDQFNAGKPWDVVKGAKIDGGHYIPLVGRRNGNLLIVTWGKVQEMTPAFFTKYNDESIVYLTDEDLKAGKTPEGFDVAQLNADLAALT
ncbi:MAG TPA: hypothetical protein VG326_19715 [Tepidisphaeraceae bacterium]|jgi:hypothetical protein|nr:hypothetical protein [Tepidisphaeraceae bacterium]